MEASPHRCRGLEGGQPCHLEARWVLQHMGYYSNLHVFLIKFLIPSIQAASHLQSGIDQVWHQQLSRGVQATSGKKNLWGFSV